MNGPVHGVATNAASAPVANAPPSPPCHRNRRHRHLEQPGRLSAIATQQQQQQRTRAGPAAGTPSRRSPRPRAAPGSPRPAPGRPARRRRYTPAPRCAHAPRSSPERARLSAFRLRIGKTQGMTLRISPPSTAPREREQRRRHPAPLSRPPRTAPGCARIAQAPAGAGRSTPSIAPVPARRSSSDHQPVAVARHRLRRGIVDRARSSREEIRLAERRAGGIGHRDPHRPSLADSSPPRPSGRGIARRHASNARAPRRPRRRHVSRSPASAPRARRSSSVQTR